MPRFRRRMASYRVGIGARWAGTRSPGGSRRGRATSESKFRREVAACRSLNHARCLCAWHRNGHRPGERPTTSRRRGGRLRTGGTGLRRQKSARCREGHQPQHEPCSHQAAFVQDTASGGRRPPAGRNDAAREQQRGRYRVRRQSAAGDREAGRRRLRRDSRRDGKWVDQRGQNWSWWIPPNKTSGLRADARMLGFALVFLHFIFVMVIIHCDDGRQLPHTRSEPAAGLRRGDGRAQPDARRPQPVAHAARRQQCAAPPARSLGDELVRRSGQGMEPTPRALALWPAVREALRPVAAHRWRRAV